MKNTNCPICNYIISDIEQTTFCPQCGWGLIVIPKNSSKELKEYYKNKIDIHKSYWKNKTEIDTQVNEKNRKIESLMTEINVLIQKQNDLAKELEIKGSKIAELENNISQKEDILKLLNTEKKIVEETLKNKEEQILKFESKSATSNSYYPEYKKYKKKSKIYLYFLIGSCIILGITIASAYFYYDFSTKRLESILVENKQVKDDKKKLNDENDKKDKKITDLNNEKNNLTHEIASRDNEITDLKSQLPQVYETLYPNQYLYNHCTGYKKADCYYPSKGTTVYIFKQENGYGLTDGGWIPMSRLGKIIW